jgi:hypothetical protein
MGRVVGARSRLTSAVQDPARILVTGRYVLMVCSNDESTEREHRYLRVLGELAR